MKQVEYQKYLPALVEKLSHGGTFLTTSAGNETNTMTIGWGTAGFMWNKPVLMVAVRYSRHTYHLLEQSKTFTVSVPLQTELKAALAFCGTKSGRDYDKFAECDLNAQAGQVIDTPVVGKCQLHYECKVVYQQAMEPGTLDAEIRNSFYKQQNYHVLYYGEIVASYITE